MTHALSSRRLQPSRDQLTYRPR